MKLILPFTLLLFLGYNAQAQETSEHSIARQWNELLLESIRNDFARPTVHSRNLYHISMAMYDAWAVYDEEASPFMLGQSIGDFTCSFDSIPMPGDIEAARTEAISYAAYRMLRHRFQFSLPAQSILPEYDSLMAELGYNPFFTSTDYSTGSPAALGNYIASCIISYGLQDGSNEQLFYENQYYEPVNPPLVMDEPGNPDMVNPNRWQPLTLEVFVDQSGNEIPGDTPEFLGPEWGLVEPFAMTEENLTIHERDSNEYWVYYDPSPPPYLTNDDGEPRPEDYQWGFALVALWSSHLDPSDGVLWDISPNNLGNIPLDSLPKNIDELRNFYNLYEGGDIGTGHPINPHTGAPYEPQIVPRADYARVLAEFWADGPDSETPPGHWFTILNYVNDHPLFEKKFRGIGEALDELEWDVKAYFTLGATMHDCAVASWGIKGWYDYTRPVSAIRRMAEFGQSTDTSLTNYHPLGLPLIEGYIEVVEENDPLTFTQPENVGEIKLKAWRGPDYISDPDTTFAGVDWILAKNWWPYQRPTFVSPPFAGYISGHSTFSRAAAEVLTALTGDPFFPGGMGVFEAKKDTFLVFEDGPSVPLQLQWATYRDASDQTSLSRIWGGIHPPADDIPGRLIGEKIGLTAFDKAETYFYEDADNDGYTRYVDCDDNNPAINPGMPETCSGLDNDCNGLVDDNLTIYTYYQDADGDNYGNVNMRLDTCLETAPEGFVTDSLDCNDADLMINPAMEEIANNDVDEDCNGEALIIDQDMDGFNSDEDCDDNNADIHPDAEEIANNGIDEDCDGEDLISSIVEIDGQQIMIYPNPIQEFLTVELEQQGNYIGQVYDLNGRLLLEVPFEKSYNQINFAGWSNGIYLLKITSTISKEVILEKIELIR